MLKTILMPEFQISQFSLSNKKKKITLQVKLLKTLLTFFFCLSLPLVQQLSDLQMYHFYSKMTLL